MPVLHACPGCGTAKEDTGRCTRCARPTNKRKQARTNTAVYQSARWARLKRDFLADATECECCGREPTPTDPLTLGHIEPFDGPDDPLAWDTMNLMAQLRSCNSREAAQRQARSTHG